MTHSVTGNFNVLVVDDDSTQLKLMSILLKAEGYEVLLANSGKAALEMVEASSPDLILLDLIMPDMNGFEVAKQLKANPLTEHLPIIMLTAMHDRQTRLRALELGVDEFLFKPIDRAELAVRVRNMLRIKNYADQIASHLADAASTRDALAKQVEQRIQAETDLLAHHEQLIQMEKLAAIGTLVGGVAHEINNPLMGLMNFVQFAADRCDDEKSRFALSRAMECVERIREITHSMLLYISPASSHATASCVLPGVVAKVLNLLGDDLSQAGITVKVDMPENLPGVICHPTLLQQVLVNLLSNARDALREQPQPRVNISAQLDGAKVLLKVCDNGTGIAKEVRSRIFDPFYTTKAPGEGTGLGLTLSRHFMEQAGGKISVHSEAGRGCCMNVVLQVFKPVTEE